MVAKIHDKESLIIFNQLQKTLKLPFILPKIESYGYNATTQEYYIVEKAPIQPIEVSDSTYIKLWQKLLVQQAKSPLVQKQTTFKKWLLENQHSEAPAVVQKFFNEITGVQIIWQFTGNQQSFAPSETLDLQVLVAWNQWALQGELLHLGPMLLAGVTDYTMPHITQKIHEWCTLLEHAKYQKKSKVSTLQLVTFAVIWQLNQEYVTGMTRLNPANHVQLQEQLITLYNA